MSQYTFIQISDKEFFHVQSSIHETPNAHPILTLIPTTEHHTPPYTIHLFIQQQTGTAITMCGIL